MIVDIKTLYNLKKNPKINEISLELLKNYYENYLHNYIFTYEIEEETEETTSFNKIELRFDLENFCHLLGIEKIVSHTVNRKEREEYKGIKGWRNVEKGVITLQDLRSKKTKGKFNNNKDKYVFFYTLPKLINNPKAALFDRKKVIGTETKIDCQILFYDQYQNAMIHLGIIEDENLGYYIPKTFFVERVTKNKNGLRYVGNQQKINVKKSTRNTNNS